MTIQDVPVTRSRRRRGRWLAAGLLSALALQPLAGQVSLDAAFERFWAAPTPEEATVAAGLVVAARPSLKALLARLEQGRPYRGDVPTGLVQRVHQIGGREFPYTLDIPEGYDPARQYQVRVQLHGGVGRPTAAGRGPASIGSLVGVEQIYVLPRAWNDAPWWSPLQVENLRAILDALKRTYNVDENRVVVSGVSDGGTGAYYLAMRDTTPYAGFLPLNGFILVLRNSTLGLQEDLFPNNLLNKPFFVVNGALDPLYPADRVQPYVERFQRGGATIAFHRREDGAHNTAWWPEVRDDFEAFVRQHPRDPLPSRLTWTTALNSPSSSRAHWLIVDRLASPRAESPLPDLNEVEAGRVPNFGVRVNGMRIAAVTPFSNADRFGLLPGDLVLSINGRAIPSGVNLVDILSVNEPDSDVTLAVSRDGQTIELREVFRPAMTPVYRSLFTHQRPAGRVDLEREGNTVRLTTRGVAAVTLLLSPRLFDFDRPIVVEGNGRRLYEGRVEPSVETLMKWAARDNDRTMLFVAELPIDLP